MQNRSPGDRLVGDIEGEIFGIDQADGHTGQPACLKDGCQVGALQQQQHAWLYGVPTLQPGHGLQGPHCTYFEIRCGDRKAKKH